MVEYAVQHHLQPGGVEGSADLREILIRAQAAVDVEIVPGVVPVAVAVKDGVKEDGVRAGGLDMVHPVQHPEDAVLLHAVIIFRRAAQAQGVDLINDCFVKPHNCLFPFCQLKVERSSVLLLW